MTLISESDYNQAVVRFAEIMDDEENPDFDELLNSIIEYEEANYPIDSPLDDVMEY